MKMGKRKKSGSKKLVLLLILCMSSLANAATILDVEVGGVAYAGQTLDIGTTVEVYIVQNMPDPSGGGGTFITNVGAGTNPISYDLTPTPWEPGPHHPLAFLWEWLATGGIIIIEPGSTGGIDFRTSKLAAPSGPTPGTPGIGSCRGDFVPICYTATVMFSFEVTTSTTIQMVVGSSWGGGRLVFYEES